MNDINVNNLDQGYEQCKELNTISSTNGENLLRFIVIYFSNIISTNCKRTYHNEYSDLKCGYNNPQVYQLYDINFERKIKRRNMIIY